LTKHRRSHDIKGSNRDTHLPPLSSSTIDLFKRGNYSLLRLLTIVNAAGPEGITTRKLLDKIGSHDTYTQRVLDKAKDLGLIERVTGESEHGQFPPVSNIITAYGKQLLQKHQLFY
jgi:DNA-binding MarR family transcriptional regulator